MNTEQQVRHILAVAVSELLEADEILELVEIHSDRQHVIRAVRAKIDLAITAVTGLEGSIESVTGELEPIPAPGGRA